RRPQGDLGQRRLLRRLHDHRDRRQQRHRPAGGRVMGDLHLEGPLNLSGQLHLCHDGGTLTVNGAEALVEGATGEALAPVLLPPPPAKPITESLAVEVVASLGKTIDTAGAVVVTTGMVLQGEPRTWPGMVLPSVGNSGPTA